MKHISLKDAHAILENCAAISWGDEGFLCYPSVSDLDKNGNNQFLYLKSEDKEGQIFTSSFIQNENERVKVSGSTMSLIDEEGGEVDITILWADDNTFEDCENV